jgi:hypothetical protein
MNESPGALNEMPYAQHVEPYAVVGPYSSWMLKPELKPLKVAASPT